MKTAIGVAALLLMLGAALPALAQLEVPSYERQQPFNFCGGVPQGERLSVPFDLINQGTAAITIDSAVASGDTADFFANYLVGSDERYLNPVMWKYINGRTIAGGSSVFNTFFFAPKTPGQKQLTLTVYYHDAAGAPLTAQSTVRFHTTDAPSGLGFLYTEIDTVRYGDNQSLSAVTYDRTIVADTLTVRDTVYLGDTLRSAISGEKRIDLTSCGGATITAITVTQEATEDILTILQPAVPFTIASGDSALVQYLYVPFSTETAGRSAWITFVTAEGSKAVLRLNIVAPPKSGVEDGTPLSPDRPTIHDERGVITLFGTNLQSAPNPFGESTTLRISTPSGAHARLSVVNILGEEVAVLLDDRLEPGTRAVTFSRGDLPAGTYFARLNINGTMLARELKIQN